MKRLLISLVIICALLSSSDARRRWVPPPATGGGGPSYLVNQNFETPSTAYDNGESWTPTVGSTQVVIESASPIKGSQSLKTSAGGSIAVTTTFTDQTDVWLFDYFRLDSLPPAGVVLLGLQDNPVTVSLAYSQIDSAGAITFVCNGTSSASALTIVAGTTYARWTHFVSGGTCEVFIVAEGGTNPNPTATKPPASDTSGHCYLSRTGISGTAGTVIWATSSAATSTMTEDHILISASVIGDNP